MKKLISHNGKFTKESAATTLPLNVPTEGLIEMLEQRIASLKRGIAQLNEASIDLSQKLATSSEVCALLNISDRTLKSLRDNRQIGFSQVGRKVFLLSGGCSAIY